jgi:murein L,D-transpeptidase YcbB/YkuD
VLAAAGAIWWLTRPTHESIALSRAIEARLASTTPAPSDTIALAVHEFYRHRGNRGAWSDGRLPGDDVDELVAFLSRAGREGLDPAVYVSPALPREIESLRALKPTEVEPDAARLAALDLRLTRAFLTYAVHVHDGRLPHSALDPDWVGARVPLGMLGALSRAVARHHVALELDDLAPTGSDYRRLRVALAHYRALASRGPGPRLSDGPPLRRGDAGVEVDRLRRRLELEGDADSTQRAPDFDARLERAVRAFQARHGLTRSGIVGDETRAALRVSAAERARQIELNMERRRWLPPAFPEPHILVSLADFTLDVRDSGRTVLHSRAVVGERRNPTPMFSAAISYLVVNPTWRLPKRVLVEELIPALHRDTTYLTRHHMRVYFTHAKQLTEVPRDSVNWKIVEDDTFPFLVVQECGPENPLGRIKFMCPNEYDVYLHDTPQKSLFSSMARAASHGCVRLEQARSLAGWLLARDTLVAPPALEPVAMPPPATPRRLDLRDSLDDVIDSLMTRRIGLKQKIPIHFMYWTAWVDSSGTVQFRDDLYGIDRRLDEALRARKTAAFVINPPLEWGEKHRSQPSGAGASPPPQIAQSPASRRGIKGSTIR